MIIFLICISIYLNSCESFHDIDKNNLRMYEVEYYPTSPDQQDNKFNFINDFKILKEISLNEKEKTLLIQSLYNKNNYLDDIVKRCLFLAKFAINVNNKITFVICLSPCSKIQIFNSNEGEPEAFDLLEDSEIEKIINKIIE